MVEARARTPQTPQGTVLVSQRADSGQSLGRIHAENLFGELCAAARTPSPNHLPVATLLEMADGASELKDHPILRSIRAYPVIRKCASKYKPEDPRGLTFLEFDQLQSWFAELIHDYGLDLLPAADAACRRAADAGKYAGGGRASSRRGAGGPGTLARHAARRAEHRPQFSGGLSA